VSESVFRCLSCGEGFDVPENIAQEKLDELLAAFMVDHIDKHGGLPHTVFFTLCDGTQWQGTEHLTGRTQ
jgi:hypothetical protein